MQNILEAINKEDFYGVMESLKGVVIDVEDSTKVFEQETVNAFLIWLAINEFEVRSREDDAVVPKQVLLQQYATRGEF